MADFKLVVSDPKSGKAYNVDIVGPKINKFVGKPIGSEIEGESAGLNGYTLVITGGSDKDGVPMRRDLPGQPRRRVLVANGTGYHAKSEGMRKRKLLRGNEISSDLVQVNAKVTGYGPQTLDEIIPKVEKPKAEGTRQAATGKNKFKK